MLLTLIRKMRILVISQQIGKSAPGIVFERVLSELTKNTEVDVDVVACEYNPSLEILSKNLQVVRYPKLHYRLNNIKDSLLNRDLISDILKYKIKLKHKNYDSIIAFCSSGHLFGLVSGIYLSKQLNCKLGCYLVDAVPAPLGWSKNDKLYRSTLKMIGRLLHNVDMIASVNKEMLDYQLTTFNHKKGLKAAVLLPPSNKSTVEIVPYEDDGIYRFLYTGNIYGLRSSKKMVEAFSLLVDKNENVELCFVGATGGEVEKEIEKYGKKVKDRILVTPRVNNLQPYYSKSIALLDIDANIDNDVFLSSKMSSYMTIDRPIICETGSNSPSRHLFKNIPSVIQCGHDANELLKAMLMVIKNYKTFDYSDRNEILNMQSSQNVANHLVETLLKLQKE